MSKDYPWGKGTPVLIRDATADDSDKSWTVPTGKIWKLVRVYGEIADTATVGNRSLRFNITDGTNVIWRQQTGNLAANQYGGLEAYPGAEFTTTTANFPLIGGASPTAVIRRAIPENFMLLAGYVVRIYDQNAIDVAADDLTVILQYMEYDA